VTPINSRSPHTDEVDRDFVSNRPVARPETTPTGRGESFQPQ